MAYYATAKIFADPFGSFLQGFRQAQEDDRRDMELLDRFRRTELAARAEERQMLSLLLDESYRRDKLTQAAYDPTAIADSVYDKAGEPTPPGGDTPPVVVEPPAANKTQDRTLAETPAPPSPAPVKKLQDRIAITEGLDTSPATQAARVTPPVSAQTGAAVAAPVPLPPGGQTLAERALLGRSQFRNPEIPSPADVSPLSTLKDYATASPRQIEREKAQRALDDYMRRRGLGEYANTLPAPVPPPDEPPGPLPQRPAGSRKYIHDRIQPDQTLAELQRAAALVQQISRALQDPNLTPTARQQLQGALQKVRNRIQQLRGQ